MHSSEKIEELVTELEGYRWDAILLSDREGTWSCHAVPPEAGHDQRGGGPQRHNPVLKVLTPLSKKIKPHPSGGGRIEGDDEFTTMYDEAASVVTTIANETMGSHQKHLSLPFCLD